MREKKSALEQKLFAEIARWTQIFEECIKLDEVPFTDTLNVLDVGCTFSMAYNAMGLFDLLIEQGRPLSRLNYVSINKSKRDMAKIRPLLERAVTFVVGDATRLQDILREQGLPDSYDLAIIRNPDLTSRNRRAWFRIFGQVNLVLAPAGRLILTTPYKPDHDDVMCYFSNSGSGYDVLAQGKSAYPGPYVERFHGERVIVDKFFVVAQKSQKALQAPSST